MANIYVRSTDGDDASSGATWALAKATMAGAEAIAAAGDTVWFSQNHSESTAGAITLAWATATVAAPIRLLCGNDSAEPPTALATTATIATTGNNAIKLTTSSVYTYLYVYGLNVRAGVGTSGTARLELNNTSGTTFWEECLFELAGTGSGSELSITGTGGFGETICKNCTWKFGHASQQLIFAEAAATVVGGSVTGTSPTTLCSPSGTIAHLDGIDLSAMASTINFSRSFVSSDHSIVRAKQCKMPASWSGSITSGTPGSSSMYEFDTSDSSDSHYKYEWKTDMGGISGNLTNVRTGGATDGLRAISWKMVSNADTEWNHQTLTTTEILRWNNTTGSSMTASIEILHDSVTDLTNQQIWIEVRYMSESGATITARANGSSGDYLSSAADHAASSATWNTTGLTNPNKQTISVTFTPQEPGYLQAVVRLAMASKTVYLCPKLEIS